MSEDNFSRAYETIEDNTDSAIGDSINESFDILTDELAKGSKSFLFDSFSRRDLRKCIIEVHHYLGEDFLNAQEIFKDARMDRKHSVKDISTCTDIELLDSALRTVLIDELPKVYEQRGDILIKKKKFKEAIIDYQECINTSVDDSNVYRIHNKLAQGYAKLGNYKQALIKLNDTLKALEKANISEKDKENFRSILRTTIDKFKVRKNKVDEQSDNNCVFALGPENQSEAGVSDKVKIQSSDSLGRYAVANEDIAPGTIVSCGDPAVAILNPDNRSLMFQFCLNCLRPAKNVHSCLTCSGVVFCSSACREAASASFHKYQCQLNLYTYRQNDTEDAFNIFMALQTLWQKPVSFFFENWNRENVELVGDVDLEYRRLWNMVSHRNNRPDQSFLKIVTITVFLLRCNRMTSYMKDCKLDRVLTRNKKDLLKNVVHIPQSDTFNEDELFIGEILGHIFMIQDTNSHPVFRLDCTKGRNQAGLECIGSGVYPVIGSFFNHSCTPNTMRVNIGKTNYLISSYPIREGEEVADIYSMHYSEINRDGRRNWLSKNFHFLCSCKACKADWPTFDKLPVKVKPELQQKLEVVEKCISSALGKGDLKAVYDLHLRDAKLLESSCMNPHRLQVSLRNSLQFACWSWMVQHGLGT